ncbi:hypothetical protein AAFF_G00342830 [Aldrovandia affinis]|uniref:Uncharacterized protein n=1 Tax=Aldrovandia affinis TaxID=143900 RepID=A0AAD7WP79_9TELE|nr:hypothetical protein AAFF_G00342830 [Aldrovandia affinis]
MVRPSAKAVGIRLEFTTDIQHVAGKDNVVADCLSRSIVDAVNLGVDYGQMAADQASDPEVQALRAATTGLQLQELRASSRFCGDGLKSFAPVPTTHHGLPRSHVHPVRVVGAADVLAIRRMSSPLPSGSDLQRASATIMPDFLCANSLLVDVRNRRLVNAETFATLRGSPSSTGTSKLSSALSSADMFQRLLMDFPTSLRPRSLRQPSSMGWIILSSLRVRRSTPGKAVGPAEAGCG